jgi:NADH-quinone oxidoreductase subunit L
MAWYIQFLIIIPILGFIGSLVIPEKFERIISGVAIGTILIQLIAFFMFLGYWIYFDFPILNLKELVIFKSKNFEFFIDFYFDKITAVFLFVGINLTLLVTIYCQYYLHKEDGFKRFFNNILLFFVGYNIIVTAGNMETLFIGWEILGLSSFMLIAFYRNRYIPVKNALKIFSIYRIADVGLILAMWASHHLWHENITFLKLINYEIVHEHIMEHSGMGVFISVMILLAAAAKSAQLPFSAWLPRAMEGPTPSSAIFYGSLSVHLGVFLLLRTYHFWEHQLTARILIALVGLSTAIIATPIARVQATVKSQIGYLSIAQIGLIFIEIALGFETLALIHFAGNAFLRTYQLLISPSIASYLIREQFYNYVERPLTFEDSLPKRIEYSFFLLSLKEWNLNILLDKLFWEPFKKAGRILNFLNIKWLIIAFVILFTIGTYSLFALNNIPSVIYQNLPEVFMFFGLMSVLKAYAERKNPLMSWILIIMNHLWMTLAISFNEKFSESEAFYYLSGIVVSGILGIYLLMKLKKLEPNINLNQYQGHSYEYPYLAFIFLLACLGITGFPITPTFIGEDLIFGHIHAEQIFLAVTAALSFIVTGISAFRMYSLLFLGPHIKTYHESHYKSS